VNFSGVGFYLMCKDTKQLIFGVEANGPLFELAEEELSAPFDVFDVVLGVLGVGDALRAQDAVSTSEAEVLDGTRVLEAEFLFQTF
jgi:hypothetical protein